MQMVCAFGGVLDVDSVSRGSVTCCASSGAPSTFLRDKRLCRFSKHGQHSTCSFDSFSSCSSCGIAFFDGRRQGLPNMLATRLFDLKAPTTVLRRLSTGGGSVAPGLQGVAHHDLVEVSVWDPELVRSAKKGEQVSRALSGLTTFGLDAEMACLHSPGCSHRFPIAAIEWSRVMALDFVVQNDDRLDTARQDPCPHEPCTQHRHSTACHAPGQLGTTAPRLGTTQRHVARLSPHHTHRSLAPCACLQAAAFRTLCFIVTTTSALGSVNDMRS